MDQLSALGSLGLGGSSQPPRRSSAASDPSGPSQAAPQLVYQSSKTAVYRSHDNTTGFKVVLHPNPSDKQFLKLMNEQRISQFLPRSCRARQVEGVTTFNERPALSFKWASGVTLKEWLQKVEAGPRVDLSIRLRAGMAIAKTLSDFHDGGVVYNGLSPENIVLSPFEGEYVATLIDLSNAQIYRKDKSGKLDASFEKQMREMDLQSLGLILNHLFRGGGYANNSGDTSAGVAPEHTSSGDFRRKRGKQHAAGEGLPLYLGSMISALLDSSPDLCYESAKDVYLDLKIIAENPKSCLMKNEVDELTSKSRLRLPENVFYGRTVQMSMLMHSFQVQQLGNQPVMAMISGYPGTGKSTLVNQIRKPLSDMDGYFIEGKFDKLARPDSVLASSLDSFFGNILNCNMGKKHISMKWRIHDAIGSESNILLDILPNLNKWLTGRDADPNNLAHGSNGGGINGSSHRLKFMFCNLIGAIACKAQPLVLFLDDLQWADEMTLDIIRMVMTDPDILHFLLLGCYRDNEVTRSHPLTEKLNAIQQQGANVVPIKIGPIEKECVNTLLSEVLCLPPSLCQPLSTVVHNKTGGIILFVLRFLASLNDEGDLWFSLPNWRWSFNLEQIRLKEIHGDVVSHMTEHMKNMTRKMQMGLKVAACLGPQVPAHVIQKITKDGEIEDSFLQSCVDFGFLREQGTSYVWSHDQIHQAAFDLIPLPKRESFHLLLGSRLFINTSPSEMEQMIFFTVDNMNRGSKLIDSVDQKWELAQLNLEAGEKAMGSSAFQTASKYLLVGISLLGPDSFDVKYDLSLRLYDAVSEALYVIGDFSRLAELSDKPLRNARSFEDKLNIHNNLVRAHAASSEFEDGIAKCVNILSHLGEDIPMDITANVYDQEVAQVMQLLHGKSRQELLSLPKMVAPEKLAAMQFMNHALSMTFIAKPPLNPILVFRMCKMSLEHGLCNISAFAFGCYGGWLVSEPTCDVEGGYAMGRVATEMTKRLNAVEMIPRLYVIVFGFINIWKEPWQAGQSKLLEAYDAGFRSGDMEYALSNLDLHAKMAIFGCGDNLEGLAQNVQLYAKRAFQCKQRTLWKSFALLHQLTLDLIGIEQNAFLDFSTGMTEDSCFAGFHDNNEISMCRLMCYKKKYVALFKGDMDTAAKMYELHQHYPSSFTGCNVSRLVNEFMNGLLGFFFARKHRDDEMKWTVVGLDAILALKRWATSSEWNFSNKLLLLEAEYNFLKEDHEGALVSYHASIKAAREHRFVHEEALAEEKLATYCLHKNLHNEAMVHFLSAKNGYKVWGAHQLVQRVDKAMALLYPLVDA